MKDGCTREGRDRKVSTSIGDDGGLTALVVVRGKRDNSPIEVKY